MKIFEKGFNYSQDGPGNRLVYHLQGCNMHCPWCSNPEGLEMFGGTEFSVDEMYREVVSCLPMFFDGGGVTFTGGEATLQLNEIYGLLKRFKANGIHTALETNGTSPELLKLSPFIDYLIIDFKHPNSEIHKSITGINNEPIKKNITKISNIRQVHIRIPLVHGFNDDEKTLYEFTEFFNSLIPLNSKFDIEILPYHEYGKEKWQKCGKEYTVTDGFVSASSINAFEEHFKKNNLTVIHT